MITPKIVIIYDAEEEMFIASFEPGGLSQGFEGTSPEEALGAFVRANAKLWNIQIENLTN